MSCDAIEGNAVVLCEKGTFGTSEGKTAHGLVRYTSRYRVLAVIDAQFAGRDAGEVLDGRPTGVPLVGDLQAALDAAGEKIDYLVIGVATHGGTLPPGCRPIVGAALAGGLNVDSGLHEMLGEDPEFVALAEKSGARIRDLRRTPPISEMHAFTGRIRNVSSVRLAVLGTDSGVGKRTTAVRLVQALNATGNSALLVGTGQTSWMQGVRYGLILDSLINDFVSGEIEHQVCRAFEAENPDVIVVEGQGCLTNPAYPGGFEILAGARPDGIILQHSPGRTHYDGFPDFPIAGVEREIQIIELLSDGRVVAITLNHEGLTREETLQLSAAYSKRHKIPCCDPLVDELDDVLAELRRRFPTLARS